MKKIPIAALRLVAIAALGTVTSLSLSNAAVAGCADFQITGTELSLNYDPFSAAPLERNFTLRIRRNDRSITAVRFLLADTDSSANSPKIGNGPGGYDIRWNRDTSRKVFVSGAEQPNTTNGALAMFGQGNSGNIATETLRISIPAGQDVPAGDYYETLEARFICYAGDTAIGSSEIQQGSGLSIDLEVDNAISTYVGSAGIRRGEIAFGPLNPNGGIASRSLVVTAQSTVPYSIAVSSQWGRLQRREGDSQGLSYQMKLSGLTVRSGSTLSCARTPAPAGRAHPFQVAIPQDQASQLPAGAYSDVVTLTFTPREGLSTPSGCSVRL